MKRQIPHLLPSLSLWRGWAACLGMAGLPWLALGCAHDSEVLGQVEPKPVAQAVVPVSLVQPTPVEGQETAAAASKLLPIGLDTVLRLAEGQNSQVAIAREKLREACAGQDLAHLAWLPTFQVGPSYFRHEGGLQNPDGNSGAYQFRSVVCRAILLQSFGPARGRLPAGQRRAPGLAGKGRVEPHYQRGSAGGSNHLYRSAGSAAPARRCPRNCSAPRRIFWNKRGKSPSPSPVPRSRWKPSRRKYSVCGKWWPD